MSRIILRSVDFDEGQHEAPIGFFIFKFDAEDQFVEGEFTVRVPTKGDLASAEKSARGHLARFMKDHAEAGSA